MYRVIQLTWCLSFWSNFVIVNESRVRALVSRTMLHLFTENLQLQLRDYLALLPNVVLKRTTGRVGVIVGRQIGASMAVGSVLVFLDAHCECTTGMSWFYVTFA